MPRTPPVWLSIYETELNLHSGQSDAGSLWIKGVHARGILGVAFIVRYPVWLIPNIVTIASDNSGK